MRVAKLLAGELLGWDAGRGTGLAYATRKIDDRQGRITVATNKVRVHRDRGRIMNKSDGFNLQGTVIDFTVPT